MSVAGGAVTPASPYGSMCWWLCGTSQSSCHRFVQFQDVPSAQSSRSSGKDDISVFVYIPFGSACGAGWPRPAGTRGALDLAVLTFTSSPVTDINRNQIPVTDSAERCYTCPVAWACPAAGHASWTPSDTFVHCTWTRRMSLSQTLTCQCTCEGDSHAVSIRMWTTPTERDLPFRRHT